MFYVFRGQSYLSYFHVLGIPMIDPNSEKSGQLHSLLGDIHAILLKYTLTLS